MRISNPVLTIVAAVALGSAALGDANPRLEYQAVADPLELPAGVNFGEVSGVALNSRGHVFVFNRGPHALVEFDKKGKFVSYLAEGLVKSSHGLRIDPEDNIWLTDVGNHVVLKLNRHGRVALVLGKSGLAGEFHEDRYDRMVLFDRPTDVAFGARGEVYVSDGYGNSRVVKFDPAGRVLKIWGKKGTGDGEFNTPHSIAVDASGKVFVADRENQRIQVFDADGRFLNQIKNVGFPYGVTIQKDHLFVADGKTDRVMKLTLEGKILGEFGTHGSSLGQFGWAHMLAVGPQQEIYVAEILNWRVQKFVPR